MHTRGIGTESNNKKSKPCFVIDFWLHKHYIFPVPFAQRLAVWLRTPEMSWVDGFFFPPRTYRISAYSCQRIRSVTLLEGICEAFV